MATLEQRLNKLEEETWKQHLNVVSIHCAGASPTAEEQQIIDEAKKLGSLVIVRLIINNNKEIHKNSTPKS